MEQQRRLRRSVLMKAIIALAVVGASAAALLAAESTSSEGGRARFRAEMTSRAPLSGRACLTSRYVSLKNLAPVFARRECARGRHANWFHARVTNVGDARGYALCTWTGSTPDRKSLSGTLDLGFIQVPNGPLFGPGQTISWDWYVPGVQTEIRSYAVTCRRTRPAP
jgi:hypothetical protein